MNSATSATRSSPRPNNRGRDRRDLHRPVVSESGAGVELLGESVPIVDAPAFFGPPIIFVLGPWLLMVLLLIPPAALLITFVLLAVVAAGLASALVALVASPYFLVRRFRERSTSSN